MQYESYSIVENFPNYAVSTFGNVINIKTGRLLRKQIKNSYYSVVLSSNKIQKPFLVHRLVAITFIQNSNLTVNHIDKNKLNNNIENLEFATQKKQIEHNYLTEPNKRSTNKALSVLRIDLKTGEIIQKYRSLTEAATWLLKNSTSKNLNSCISGIRNVIIGKTKYCFNFNWKYEEINNTNEFNEKEEWRMIPLDCTNGKENYHVSSLGRFKNNAGIIMKNYKNAQYIYIQINKKRHALHRLIALLFIDNPENKNVVNHIDGNKLNNCVSNLEWVTKQENTMHAYKTGLIKKFVRKINQYDKNMIFIEQFESIISASKKLNVDKGSIGHVCSGKSNSAGGYIFRYV
jgi:hypothetical protein